MLSRVTAAGVPPGAATGRLLSRLDRPPPTPPSGLVATTTGATISLQWTGSVDDTGVASYVVYRSTTPGSVLSPGNFRTRTTWTSFADQGLGNGTYYYVVTAQDLVGNISAPSNDASATVLQDIFAPFVDVTAPASYATVNGAVTLIATA